MRIHHASLYDNNDLFLAPTAFLAPQSKIKNWLLVGLTEHNRETK
jgi:hypothetical protein